MQRFEAWLEGTSIVAISGMVLLLMVVVAYGGNRLRARHARQRSRSDHSPTGTGGQEGYVTSAMLGLLALLIGFTFALAVDRYETRRLLVIDEANNIGTAWLRAQLLPPPHRARVSELLQSYVDLRLATAAATPAKARDMAQANSQRLTDLWTATVAAFPAIKDQTFSAVFVSSINAVIDSDEARRSSRQAKVPAEVFLVLFVYVIVTSGSLGYTVSGVRGLVAASVLLMLILLSLMMTVDLDRPTSGAITESQAPMLRLRASMAETPLAEFDRWNDASPADAGASGGAAVRSSP